MRDDEGRLKVSTLANRTVSFVAIFVLIFALAAGPFAGTARACSCGPAPLKDEIERSDAVFSGEVRSIDENASSLGGSMEAPGRMTFDVKASWKGAVNGTVDVYGQGDGANCYNLFEEGETYVVYASSATNDALKNNECGATKPLRYAEKDLRLLGLPEQLTDTGGPSPSTIGALVAAAALLVSAGLLFRWARS